MMLKDFACLLGESSRAKAYIQKLVAHSFLPTKAVYLDLSVAPKARSETQGCSDSPPAKVVQKAFQARKYFLYSKSPQALFLSDDRRSTKYRSFDPDKSVLETLKEAGIDYQIVQAASLNDAAVLDAVQSLSETYLLFSGGGILGREILSLGKKFIHIHPGFLPDVRGSLAVEWTVLLSKGVAASALFMAEQIDAGDVMMTRHFDPPELEHGGIPPYFSSHIRSEVLLDLVREYARTGRFRARPQNSEAGETYYKMHPALNNLVFSKLLKLGRNG